MNLSNIVILNYDLGIQGDYDSLYAFLDNHNALDCGNSNCFFKFNFVGNDLSHSDKFKQLKETIESDVDIEKKDRIYVIVHDDENTPRGTFIFGRRKTPVWEGYGDKKDESGLPF